MDSVSAIREVAKHANAYGIGRDIHIGDTNYWYKRKVGFESSPHLL